MFCRAAEMLNTGTFVLVEKNRQKCKNNYLKIQRNKIRWIVEKQPRHRNEGKLKPIPDSLYNKH